MGCEQTKPEEAINDIICLTVLSSSEGAESEELINLSYREMIHQDRGKISQLYTFINILSKTNRSIIRHVVNKSSNQVKICKILGIDTGNYLERLREIEFLKKLDHPNIVHVVEYFIEPAYMYIICEDIAGKNIANHKNVEVEKVIEIVRQILLAISYCHKMDVCHCGIDGNNVMVVWKGDYPVVKIIGFGKAVAKGRNKSDHLKEYEDLTKLDVLNCGYLFYSLLGGKIKLNRLSEIIGNLGEVVGKLSVDKALQSFILDLLNSMLNPNSSVRSSSLECLQRIPLMAESTSNSYSNSLQKILSFHPHSKLEYFVRMYISMNLTETLDRVANVREFYLLDMDCDGELCSDEISKAIMETLEISLEDASKKCHKIFKSFSKDKNSYLTYSEYILGTLEISKYLTDNLLRKVFDEMDTNKDGLIEESDINNLVSGIGKDGLMDEDVIEINFMDFKRMIGC